MFRPAFASATLALCFGLSVAAPPANAFVSHAWVSGRGTDAAGCGSIASPCRTFQYTAGSILAAGGEIDVADPANYGPITITSSLTIVNGGVGTAAVYQPTAGANAITINAGPHDSVALIGLTINGLGVAANGIQFNGGNVLSIVDSTIFGFAGAAVNFTPNNGAGSHGVLLLSAGAMAGGNVGTIILKPAAGTNVDSAFTHCNLVGGNPTILLLDASLLAATDSAYANVSNCFVGETNNNAIVVNSVAAAARVTVDHTLLRRSTIALTANGPIARIDLNASTLSNNSTVVSASGGGVVNSFGNNAINFYTTLGPLTSIGLQ